MLPPVNGRHADLRGDVPDRSRAPALTAAAGSIPARSRTSMSGTSPPWVIPPSNGGLHCGPPNSDTCSAAETCWVFPPFRGGLHCSHGWKLYWQVVPMALLPSDRRLHCGLNHIARIPRCPTCAPAVRRRAPLRPGPLQAHRLRRADAPAVRRRAPLRRSVPHLLPAAAVVLPPLNGGLHCGTISVSASNPSHGMLPPFNGGLHCGPPCTSPVPAVESALPPPSGGLHCGRSLLIR